MTSHTILVVDDEPAILALVEHRLVHEGFQVFTAADGGAAWHRIVKEQPDLIVLDLMLPGIPGLELLRQIRAHYSVRSHAAIQSLTSPKNFVVRALPKDFPGSLAK